MGCANWLSSKCQSFLLDFMDSLGVKLWRYPFRFLLSGILLSLICAIGIVRLSLESRSYYLWIPRNSEIWFNYLDLISYYGSFDQWISLIAVASDSNEDNSILTTAAMTDLWDAYQQMYQLNYTADNGEIWTYDRLCVRAYPSAPYCDDKSKNLFTLFGNNVSNWQSDSAILNVINYYSNNVPFLAGITHNSDTSQITGATTVAINYELEGTTDVAKQDASYEIMSVFEQYWADHHSTYDTVNLYYLTAKSFDDEVMRLVSADIPIFGAALLIMVVYLSITLGQFSCVGARIWLGTSAVWVLILAVLIAFGICGAVFNLKANIMVLLIPYILLGVGCDDMIIIKDSLDNTPLMDGNSDDEDERRGHQIGHALRHAGLSITLSSLCSVVAFAVGAVIDIPGVKSFCIYCAMAFLANYILQFLIFVPILIYDQKRITSNRNFCCPCFVHNQNRITNDNNNSENNNKENNSDTVTMESNHSNADENKNGFQFSIVYLLERTLVPLLSIAAVRRALIVAFLSSAILSIVSFNRLNTESDLTRLVPDNSFVLDYLTVLKESRYDSTVAVLSIIIQNCDFSDTKQRSNVHSMIAELENISISVASVDQWLLPFESWLNDTLPVSDSIDTIDSQTFYHYLKTFANVSEYKEWSDEIHYDNDDNPSKVVSTRFYWNALQPQSMKKQWPLRNYLNGIVHKYVNGYMYEYTWVFAYLSSSIIGLSLENIGFATIGLAMALIFLMDIRIAALIIITVLMIDINLFGWLVLTDTPIDTISYVTLVMAVGLAVDYVIHIAHSIMEAKPTIRSDYKARLKLAISDMGGSVFKGAFTTMLGAVSLFFSSSAAFRTFAIMFSGIVLISIIHGMIFVPCVLGEIYHFCCVDDVNDSSDNNERRISEHMNNNVLGTEREHLELSKQRSEVTQQSQLLEESSGEYSTDHTELTNALNN